MIKVEQKEPFKLKSCYCEAVYLGDDSLSCAIVFKEQVVSLDEELAGVFLFPSSPLPPQDDWTMGALLVHHTAYTL